MIIILSEVEYDYMEVKISDYYDSFGDPPVLLEGTLDYQDSTEGKFNRYESTEGQSSFRMYLGDDQVVFATFGDYITITQFDYNRLNVAEIEVHGYEVRVFPN